MIDRTFKVGERVYTRAARDVKPGDVLELAGALRLRVETAILAGDGKDTKCVGVVLEPKGPAT